MYAVGSEPLYDSVWDAELIFGCLCRKGYHGYDCSQRTFKLEQTLITSHDAVAWSGHLTTSLLRVEVGSCPRGDDPLTTGQKNEVQVLQCTATGGFFHLFFNGQGTTVPFDATASQLEGMLGSLKTLSKVKVTYTGTATTLCSTTSNAVLIEFVQAFGPQPPIKVMSGLKNVVSLTGGNVFATSAGGVLAGRSSIQGSKEWEFCSNRGDCNHDQLDEVQVLKCIATGGNFRLLYRMSASGDIPFDASSSTLRNILMTSFGFEDLVVEYTSGAQACSAPSSSSSNVIVVTFPLNHGNLPSLRAITMGLTPSGGPSAVTIANNGAAIDGFVSQIGTKESAVCSNRGYCSHLDGTCVCSFGYGSSDGHGNHGNRGDCGHILSKVKYVAQE
ncbi:hypothetical protein BBJ28_00002466 [Nothophytophthora sp. Chile5]|nr:hypothetical protein BBJ28_00002466 [Nothophytophthora sp. Chile5]